MMIDERRSKKELIRELASLRQRNQELELTLSRYRPADEYVKLLGSKISDGTVDKISSITHNNTEYRQIEKALLQIEQEKLDILESITDSFVSLDSNYCFTYLNKAAEKVMNNCKEKLIGKIAYEVFPGFKSDLFLLYRQITEERKPQHYEILSYISQRWFDISIYPFRDGVSIYFRDIHERKLLEQELQQQAAFLELADDAILICDLESRIIYWNKGSEQLYGWSKDEAYGQTTDTLLNTQFPESLAPTMKALLDLDSWKGILVHTTKNGNKITVSSHQVLQCNEHGDPTAILAINRDITARKQAEKALEESQQQMEQVIEFLPDATMVVNLQGQVVFWNKAMEDMTGITKDQMIGKGDYEYALPFYGERRPTLIDLALVSESEYSAIKDKYDYICKEGYKLFGEHYVPKTYGGKGAYLMGSASKLYDLQGNTSGAIHSIRDITNRKQGQEALRLSEERFSMTFKASPMPVGISRKEDGVYIDVNDSYTKLAGYSREEMVGRSSMELMLWNDPLDRDELLKRLQNGEKVKDIEINYNTKQGQKRLALVSMEPIIVNQVDCVITMFIDITEHRQMEKDLARLDRLNLIGEMAASIGHEIRNPMTAIRGFLQMLSSKKEYGEDQIYFNIMIDEIDRANEIITEYLGMAKDKKVDLRNQYLDEVVKSLFPIIQADAYYQGMEVMLDLSKPPMLLIDAKEIRQMILNMARNGLEAMSAGGKLTIGTNVEGEEIVLFIKDEGHGVDLDLLDKLGTPFVTTKDNGTGLGLAVCYSIAARLNARIDYKTGPEGTTFFVRFPMPVEQFVSF